MSDPNLAQWLCEHGFLQPEQLQRVLDAQRDADPAPGVLASVRSLELMTEDRLVEAVGRFLGVEAVDLEANPPDPELYTLIPAAVAQSLRLVPLGRENGHVRVATSEAITAQDREKIEFIVGSPVKLSVASEKAILDVLREIQGVSVENLIAGLSKGDAAEAGDGEVFSHDLREMAQEPTLINLVNAIIMRAIEERTSDIHVEPFENELKIRYRVDGILQEQPPPPKQFQSAIVSRIKIMAGMDIAERYVPQDGQIRVNLSHAKVDIRVSTVPTIHGETVVLRLLTKDESLLELKSLGMHERVRDRFIDALARPYGIILVCGPTGSGKTTTLYCALKQVFTPEKKIITIEDPVEYEMPGVIQIPVRPKRGMTFATGLRAVLRQDPDIILVGEVRDKETAEIAIRAALTGHLVLSTLHTNDAPGAVTRLTDMGIEPFLIASSVQAMLAQRLVRRLCRECRQLRPLDPETKGLVADHGLPAMLYEPVGCEECRGRGYQGRLGIHEILMMNDKLHDVILHAASASEIKSVAGGQMVSMRVDGFEKAGQGFTSIAEVMQATQFDDQGKGA